MLRPSASRAKTNCRSLSSISMRLGRLPRSCAVRASSPASWNRNSKDGHMPADFSSLKQDLTRRMDGALDALKREFGGLRTGRASPALLDPIKVDAYGQMMPINQVATVAVPESRMLTVQVWDRSMVNSVVAAIRDCGLGLNPQPDGQMVRVPLPMLTEERRNELARTAAKYAENARIAVRGVRRDGMEQIKALQKKHEISEDDERDWSEQVQKLTDGYIKRLDESLADKEKDIRQV